ncbi:MAG: sensor histidine kinase [Clostridia bacterium]|nr:sensor histidine kinase [Clostridia bacterium]
MIEKKLCQLINTGAKGAFAGIVIAMLYMLASFGSKIHLPTISYFLLFGISAGFFISFLAALADRLCKQIFAGFGKYLLIPQLISTYIVSALTFFCLSFIISKVLLGYYPEVMSVFNACFWTGMASLIVALIFKVIEEKEEKLHLEKENRELAVIEERSRIARELHDSVSQNLFGISLSLKTAEFLLDTDMQKTRAIIGQLQGMVQEVQTEMRLMIYELRPLALENKSFFEALENLAGLFRMRYNLDLKYNMKGNEESIGSAAKVTLYRILQESLNNVVKHAQADTVTVTLEINNGTGKMMIKDDGRGCDTVSLPPLGCYGINNMRERIKSLGGQIAVDSSSGKGTTVTVVFPVQHLEG